ncbi:unnamed protein product [Mytilus edulis]|uniref:Uncharacterized protein n=1 Tax=Mytilus edulis TaxID=6550 RepID=A0A8S3QA57_MYTED|nr:unnamed protein product [Mytilus edulis]
MKVKVARNLGLPAKTLAKGRKSRTRVLQTEKSSWTYTLRKSRSDAMSEDEKKTAYNFWLSPSISRPTGNKKDIKRKLLEFQTTHPDIKIKQRKFENLKPYFVRAARQQDRSTCCCRYHIEARSIFKKCMEFRKNVLTNHDVADTIQIKVFETLSDLINTTLCEKESHEKNHKIECLDRNCDNCSIPGLILMQEELDTSELAPDIKWERYEHAILEIDGEESTVENPSIITEQFFVFSPDESHDTYFTHDVRKLVTNYLSSISAYVTTIHEFTDGCQAQYKSRHCLGDFSYSKEDFGFDQYFRNFFETSHAKGPQDAAGGFVKRQANIAVLRSKVTIKTAEDMYQFAIQNLTKPNESASCKRRIFRLLDNTERDELRRFKPVPDNRSIHCVHCLENGIISVKKLSCYSCDSCINGNYSHCQNCHITGTERKITMTREDELNRENDIEDEDETEIKDLVNRGCIIAVVADDPNDDYFLLKASGKAQVLSVDTTDKWGAHFLKGSEIIRGLYFNKLTVEDGMVKFKLLQRKTALVPAVSTRFICMDLDTSNEGILTMPEDTHLAIIDSL